MARNTRIGDMAMITVTRLGKLLRPESRETAGAPRAARGFTLLELSRKYYREAGLDVRQLELLVR